MRRYLLCTLLVMACSGTCGGSDEPHPASPTPLGVAAETLLEQEGSLTAAGRANFEVAVSSGDHLEVQLTSQAFDPILEVTPPGGGTLTNDDWQGRRNESRLSVVVAEAGTMKIGVGRMGAGTGGFRVTVQRTSTSAASGGPPLLSVGGTHEGTLDATDGTLPDGRFNEWVTVSGPDAGQLELRIEAQSETVPLAIVLDPNNTALQGTRGVYVLSHPGLHRAQLIAPTPGQPASYRMSLRPLQNLVTPTLSRTHHQLPTQTSGTPLSLGQTVRGTLDRTTRLPSGEPAEVYVFTGRTGQRAQFELRSNEFDTYLMVLGPTGRHWENDDTAGTTNSAIDLQLPVDGSYRVIASAYRAGMSGSFELKASELPDTPILAAMNAIGGSGLGSSTASPTSGNASPQAELRRGELAPGDATLQTGELRDTHEFTWPAGATFDVSLTSSAFDTYLIVRPPSGDQLDNDDAAPGETNSHLQVHAQVAGTYRVVVTSYRPGESGPYELRVTPVGQAPPTPATPTVATPSPGVTAGHRTITGELTASDRQLPSGEFIDAYPLTLREGQAVHLEARSSAFDTYLILREPGGAQHDNDDGPDGTNAALDFVAPTAGQYTVSVTSYRPGERGPYELWIRDGTPNAGQVAAPTGGAGGRPVNDDNVRGTLAQGDRTLRSGEFADLYTRSFTPGQPVEIRLASNAFDPYLIVRTPSGRQLDNDDLTPSTRDAGVDVPAAEAGNYHITVTSYRPGETGAYELTFAAGRAAPRPNAAPGQGGHVFGLFAGITDYPDGVGDLPECANDAIKLAEALRDANLLDASRQVLLTDAAATRAALAQGLQRLSSQMGPDDVFVFFYSGHGGQQPNSQDPREIDGTDEFLVLHDGPVLDDELARLFEPIRARVSVVALDACYSGGFAKDLITRPGRVGFFSSEEDVLSAVAGQFQAGGYLSHFIRLAVSGEADQVPADRVLTVGELSHFLYRQFGRHATDVQLQGAFQHLVVDRGAVHGDQVLWRYR